MWVFSIGLLIYSSSSPVKDKALLAVFLVFPRLSYYTIQLRMISYLYPVWVKASFDLSHFTFCDCLFRYLMYFCYSWNSEASPLDWQRHSNCHSHWLSFFLCLNPPCNCISQTFPDLGQQGSVNWNSESSSLLPKQK